MIQSCAQLPTWVQYLQAFLTPAIAVLVAVIGWFQWRTAHQRAVLDLFDKRMEVHDEISAVIRKVVQTGKVKDTIAHEFWRASARVDLLFGPEVGKYLRTIYDKLADMAVADHAQEHGTPDERMKAAEKRMDRFSAIDKFFVDFPKLVRPYVKMHQKAPWF